MKIDGWTDLIKSVKTPLRLLTLITLIFGSLLYSNTDPKVVWMSLVVLFLITVFCLFYVAKNKTLFPSEIKSIWSKNDLPLTPEERDAWLGSWNCRWTYTSKEGELLPYVDDVIEIENIECVSGELSGIGLSSYVEGDRYFLKGRVSNKRVAHVFYTSSAETAGLSGMFILNRPPIGNITGWWLGAGRSGGDIGGGVTMEKSGKNKDFVIKNYELS